MNPVRNLGFYPSLFGVLLLIAISVGVSSILFFRLTFLTAELGDTRFEILSLEKKSKDIKELLNFLAEAEQDRELIESLFVSETTLIRFIEDLEEIGKESEIELRVESVNQASDSLGPSFRLQAQGSFSNLFRYLRLLESLPYQLAFDEVRLQKLSGDQLPSKKVWRGTYVIRVLSYNL